jgi:hypothetical protein
MKPLTVDFIYDNSRIHPIGGGRMFTMEIGDFILSIVGGRLGLYGDFEETFEVALLVKGTNNFVTSYYATRGDDVIPYASIDEINQLYYNIPRTK